MASVLKDESAIIKGDLIVKNVRVESDFDSGHMINNINISNLEHQLVSKSSNESIGSITFMTDVKINDVTAHPVLRAIQHENPSHQLNNSRKNPKLKLLQLLRVQ